MSNKKNNGLYSPSSFKSGYNQKQKYDLVYSPQKSVEYTFSYYDELRRKLNYIFEYLVFPKYGRYTFIYDITDLLIVENPPVLLKRDLNSISFNDYYKLDELNDKIGFINENKEHVLKKDIFSIINDSIVHDLRNVDKTIDYFVDYSKVINKDSIRRKTTLFSNGDYVCKRDNSIKAMLEKYTIFDFSVDNSIDLLAKLVSENEDILLGSSTYLNRNISQIKDTLKNDYKLQRIIEDLYIHRLGELNLDTEKNPKSISTYNHEQGLIKDTKNIECNDETFVFYKNNHDVKVEQDEFVWMDKIYTDIDVVNKDNYKMDKIYTDIQIEDINTVQVDKVHTDIVVEYEEHNDLRKKSEKIDISSRNSVNLEESNKVLGNQNIVDNFLLKSKIREVLSEEQYKLNLKDIPNHEFDIDALKSTEKQLETVPSKELSFKEEYNLNRDTISDGRDNDEVDISNSTEELERVEGIGFKLDVLESPYDLIRKPEHSNSLDMCEDDYLNLIRKPQHDNSLDTCEDDSLDLNREAGRYLVNNSENNAYLNRNGGRQLTQNENKCIDRSTNDDLTIDDETRLSKSDSRAIQVDDDIKLKKEKLKNLELELDKQLDLHKRFWFVKSLGKIDYKILPNKDFSYPTDINIFVEKPNYIYSFDFDVEYQDITSDKMIIELYGYDYNKVDVLEIPIIQTGTFGNDKIDLKIETYRNKAKFDLKINHDDLYYIIIRQPKDIDGCPVLYTVTKKFLGDNKHPIPFGSDLGTREIAIHINVMVDFINIMMLMWSKFYYQFTGYTGIQAMYGILNLVHEWLTLETSLEVDNIEEFHRCFRWLRWEAEKLYNIAKNDPHLTGNAWVEELIYQLVEYMEMHHMNEIPEFDPTHLMDEYRNIFDDPSFDIEIVIDKVKGVRKRAIDTNKISRNKK